MSKYRQAELLAAKSITTAGTETLEIKTKDVISRLSVIVRLTNSSWTPTGHPAKVIKTITLQDGSNVLHSMRGIYTQALSFYSSMRQPFNYINYTDNGIAVAVAPIYFGRDLWDEELALDPKQFDNLILNIAHDYALGGAVPDAATLEVWADIFDEKPVAPVGFLKGTSHWSKTLVASTNDYVTLPTDLPIRLLVPAVSSDSEEPDINIDSIKLTENGDKKVILEMGTLEILQMLESLYPQYIEYCEGRSLANTDISFYVTPCKDINLTVMSTEDSDAIYHTPWSGGNKRIIDGSLTATCNVGVNGRCPHGAFPLAMGDQKDPLDWWEVAGDGSRRIRMTTGGGDTAALYELLLQEKVTY